MTLYSVLNHAVISKSMKTHTWLHPTVSRPISSSAKSWHFQGRLGLIPFSEPGAWIRPDVTDNYSNSLICPVFRLRKCLHILNFTLMYSRPTVGRLGITLNVGCCYMRHAERIDAALLTMSDVAWSVCPCGGRAVQKRMNRSIFAWDRLVGSQWIVL